MNKRIKERIMLVVNHKHFAMGTALAALFGLGLLAANDVKAQETPSLQESPLLQKRVPMEVFCGETNVVHEILARQYGEYPIAMSVNSKDPNGNVGPAGSYMIWFVNEERTTFSIVSDGGMGVSCIILAGSCSRGNCFIPNATAI